MFRISVPLAIIAVLLLVGCTSATAERTVRTEYDKASIFKDWKSYRFSTDGTSQDSNYPKYEKMIQKALEEELTARGYSRIEDGAPDFRVAFELVFRGEKTQQIAPKGGGADPMARSYAGPTPSGSLTIKMLDPVSGQILWSGHISDIKMTAIEPYKELRKAVWRVLVEFPPLSG